VERVKGEEETRKRKRNGSHANLQKTTANIGATIWDKILEETRKNIT